MRRLLPAFLVLAALAGCKGAQTEAADVKSASSGIAPSSGQGDPPPDMPKKGPAAGGG